MSETLTWLGERGPRSVEAAGTGWEQLRALLDALPIPALLLEGETAESAVVTEANQVSQSLLFPITVGVRLADLVRAIEIRRPDAPEPLPVAEWPLARALSSGELIHDEELHIRLPDGQTRILLVGAVPMRRGDRITAAVVTLQDITERQRAEEAARRLAAIVESSEDAIISKTLENCITDWNPGAERLFGYSAEEMIGRSFSQLVAPDQAAMLPPLLEKLHHDSGTRNVEIVGVRKDGTHVDLSLSVSPVRDTQGRVVRAATIARDITDRKRAAEAVAQSEARYRLLIETSPDGIVVTDAALKLLIANQQAVAMCGWDSPADLIGHSALEFIRPEDHQRLLNGVDGLKRTGRMDNLTLTLVRRDCSRFPAEVNASIMVDAQGNPQGLLGVVRDVTGRKVAEDALARSEARFRALAANAPDMIFRMDRGLRLLYFNPAVAEGTGIITDACLGRNLWEVGFPTDFAALWEEKVCHVIATGEPERFEFDIPGPDVRHHEARLVPELAPDGSVASVLALSRDITDRKRAEAERERLLDAANRAKAEAEEANRAKDQFVAMVSHELRNPLNTINAGLFARNSAKVALVWANRGSWQSTLCGKTKGASHENPEGIIPESGGGVYLRT